MAYYDPYTFENNSLRLLYHSSKPVDENPLKICGLSGLYMRTILLWLLYESSKPVDENPFKISGLSENPFKISGLSL